MPLALVPVLAQTLAVEVGDRTELRQTFDRQGTIMSAETTPLAGAAITGRRTQLRLRYLPSLTLTPLTDAERRELLLFHNAQAVNTTRVAKRTTLTVSTTAGYGERNFRVAALALPASTIPPANTPGTGAPGTGAPGTGTPGTGTPGTGTPGTGTPGTGTGGVGQGTGTSTGSPRALDDTVTYGVLRADAVLTQILSRRSTFAAGVGYDLSGGIGEESSLFYPSLRGPDARASYTYQLSQRDTTSTNAFIDYVDAAGGNKIFTASADQGYNHFFSESFRAGLSVGIAYTRTEESDGTVTHQIFPTFGLGSGAAFSYSTQVAGGTLSLQFLASYSPVVDSVSGVLDPRIGLGVGAAYDRQALSIFLRGNSTLSLRPNEEGALSGVLATAGASYDLGAGFAVDGGIRSAWQSFQGSDVVPLTWAIYIGLSWGAEVYNSAR